MKYNRIPRPLEQGRFSETSIDHIWIHGMRKEYNDYIDPCFRMVLGFPIPEFQRPLCWTEDQQIKFIESVWLQIPIGTYTYVQLDWDLDDGKPVPMSGWLIDGQQRLTALERYWNDEFPVFNLKFSELNQAEKRRFLHTKFCHYEIRRHELDHVKDIYRKLAFGGVPHTEEDFKRTF